MVHPIQLPVILPGLEVDPGREQMQGVRHLRSKSTWGLHIACVAILISDVAAGFSVLFKMCGLVV